LFSTSASSAAQASSGSAQSREPVYNRARSLDDFQSSLFGGGYGNAAAFVDGLPVPRRVGRLRPMHIENSLGALAAMDATFKNCLTNGLPSCTIPYTTTTHGIMRILLKDGMIRGFRFSDDSMGLEVFFKYLNAPSQGGATAEPAIHGVQLLSRPSRLFYVGLKELKRVSKAHYPSLFIVRTSQGVMSHFEALRHGYGGEVLCRFI
jgi:ribosomal protein S8